MTHPPASASAHRTATAFGGTSACDSLSSTIKLKLEPNKKKTRMGGLDRDRAITMRYRETYTNYRTTDLTTNYTVLHSSQGARACVVG
jgi:hypothetical protein